MCNLQNWMQWNTAEKFAGYEAFALMPLACFFTQKFRNPEWKVGWHLNTFFYIYDCPLPSVSILFSVWTKPEGDGCTWNSLDYFSVGMDQQLLGRLFQVSWCCKKDKSELSTSLNPVTFTHSFIRLAYSDPCQNFMVMSEKFTAYIWAVPWTHSTKIPVFYMWSQIIQD